MICGSMAAALRKALREMKSRAVFRRVTPWSIMGALAAIFMLHAVACSWFRVCLHGPDISMRGSLSFFSSSATFSKGKIEWLHIPKAGTSFGNSLIRWACPTLPKNTWINHLRAKVPEQCLENFRVEHFRKQWPIGDHFSLANRTDEELSRVFTMVRSPWSRSVSGYHFIQKVVDHRPSSGASTAKMCDYIRKSRYAHAALGAQTKIIAGEVMENIRPVYATLKSSKPPNFSLARKACNRLQQFAFVGISDSWEASMCFFHAMFGGKMESDELINVRPGGYKKAADGVDCGECYDAADEVVYSCALDIFEKYAQQYPQCLKNINVPAGSKSAASPIDSLRALACRGKGKM